MKIDVLTSGQLAELSKLKLESEQADARFRDHFRSISRAIKQVGIIPEPDPAPKKRRMSEAVKQHLSRVAKARWVKARRAGRNKL